MVASTGWLAYSLCREVQSAGQRLRVARSSVNHKVPRVDRVTALRRDVRWVGTAYWSVADIVRAVNLGSELSIESAAAMQTELVLGALGSRESGLTPDEVSARAEAFGPNAVRSHHVTPWSVLFRQLHSPLLWLLLAAAAVSAFVGEGLDALIIGIIVAASVGLGFVNEFRAERAAEAMHSEIHHNVAVTRDGSSVDVEVTHLVPGDIVHLGVGSIIPADVRILTASNLECDESILTGESIPAVKSSAPATSGTTLAELSSCLFMGTVVHEGAADAVVVAIGPATQFGRIALGLGERHPETEFQLGLTRFSGLLAKVGGVLSVTIFVINVALGRPVIDAVLFSLAVAVGITPQLLPAVVSTSLATGSRRLAEKKVLVKRLVCIEDLGDIDVLFTDKTGTLTDGHISFERSIDPSGSADSDVLTLGLVCNEATPTGSSAIGGNPLDVALWEAPGVGASNVAGFQRIALAPFDHDRRCVSVLVDGHDQRILITKGAPETVLDRCNDVSDGARQVLEGEFRAGNRVVAIATPESSRADHAVPRRRARPGPRRIPRVPRSTQTVGRRIDRTTVRTRHHRQDRHGRQPPRRRNRLPGPGCRLGRDAHGVRPRRHGRRRPHRCRCQDHDLRPDQP